MSKEKISRNKRILKLRKMGKSYRQLGKTFKLNVRAVFDIVKRMEARNQKVDNSG